MFELIEHLINPKKFLLKVSRQLNPGGHLIISTPDISNLMFNLLKRKWPAIHPETHNYYYSPPTLEHFLNRFGFTRVSIKRRYFLRKDVKHLRRKLKKMFPCLSFIWDMFKVVDNRMLLFPSGGSMNCIFVKTK